MRSIRQSRKTTFWRDFAESRVYLNVQMEMFFKSNYVIAIIVDLSAMVLVGGLYRTLDFSRHKFARLAILV